MFLAVAILGPLVAAAMTVRWALTRVDALGRPRSFPVVSTVLPLVLAVVAAVPVVRHARVEAQLGQVASQLVGHPVRVRCDTLSQELLSTHTELGYVQFGADGRPEPVATVTSAACGDLTAWLGSRRANAPVEQLVAVHVLTHEAMHLTGMRDEAQTECMAVQRDVRTATLLGATPGQARALARLYWQIVYPDLPDNYRTAQCAEGGPLDEHLPDPPWAPVKTS